MTRKQFSKYVPDICNGYTVSVTIVNNESGKQSASVDDFVDLLNEQHETIQRLKRQIDNLQHTKDFCAECCEILEKENEQLKSEIKEVRGAYEQLWMSL